jgi:hypothetical protein
MRVQRLITAVAAAMLASAPAAMAQPLPAGGVLVDGMYGLEPDVYSHGHLCSPDKVHTRFSCVLGKKQTVQLSFSYRGNPAAGCSFQVGQVGDPPHNDAFSIGQRRDPTYKGRCTMKFKSNREIQVGPAQ